MRQTNKILQAYYQYASNKSAVNVSINKYGFVDIIPSEGETASSYNPSYIKYLMSYLNDDEVPNKIIIGAYGSGKTSALANVILRDAVLIAPCDDGVRRSRIAFIRNTAGQLETTTLRTWLFWTKGLPFPQRNKKPQLTYTYKFNDARGEIHLEVLFLALDRDDDVSKLDSLELTSAVFNELRHIPERIFNTVLSRIGRYPSKVEFMSRFKHDFGDVESEEERNVIFRKWRPYRPRIYADTNAPKSRHWIAELEKRKPANTKVYHQPPALVKDKNDKWVINADADNLLFVGDNYYLDMIDRGEEFIKVYARGEYGTIVDGKPVYPNYNDDLHSTSKMDIIPGSTIYMGCDYGITAPACILAQFHGSQLRIFKEFVGEYESIKSMFAGCVVPYLNLNCIGCPIEIIGDPADTSSGRAQLVELGFMPTISSTNRIDARISSVTNILNVLIGGRPRLLVSRDGCPLLREGFLGEYHYRRLKVIGDDKFVDEPNKTHPYSDLHDALQYIVIRICEEARINFDSYSSHHYHSSKVNDETKSKVTGY
jgi:hypothetical protein